jgi:hypothetical protein
MMLEVHLNLLQAAGSSVFDACSAIQRYSLSQQCYLSICRSNQTYFARTPTGMDHALRLPKAIDGNVIPKA